MSCDNRVRVCRQEEAISKAELARLSELSYQTIRRIENEDGPFSPTTKRKIRNGFNNLKNKQRTYTVDYLFPQSPSEAKVEE